MSLSLGQHYFHNGDINPDITVHYSDSFSKPPRFTFLIYLKISISFSLIFLNDCKLSKSLISRWFLFMLCGGSIVYLFESHAVNDTKANKYSHSFDDIDDLNQGTANFELYLSGIYDISYIHFWIINQLEDDENRAMLTTMHSPSPDFNYPNVCFNNPFGKLIDDKTLSAALSFALQFAFFSL